FRWRERRCWGLYRKPLATLWFPAERHGGREREALLTSAEICRIYGDLPQNLLPPPCSLFVQMACRMDVYTQAKQLGIQTEFVDGQGHRHVTDATALKIILNALPERIPFRLLDGPVVIRAGRISRTE